MLTLLIISYWILMDLVNVIPLIGPSASTLCIPAFSVSLLTVSYTHLDVYKRQASPRRSSRT